MKKPLKTTDAIQKWLNGMNSGILRPNANNNVVSMTREKLDSKSDIAAELNWRDRLIEQLNERIKELESQKHINEIKAQGIEEAVKKADNETYIGVNGEFPPQKQYRAEILVFADNLKIKHD